jgi:hypothetical protein
VATRGQVVGGRGQGGTRRGARAPGLSVATLLVRARPKPSGRARFLSSPPSWDAVTDGPLSAIHLLRYPRSLMPDGSAA